MKYLIDANTFITPHRGYAPMDVAVTLWDKFKNMSAAGSILLLDRVQQELFVNADALHQWVDANFSIASIVSFRTIGKLYQIMVSYQDGLLRKTDQNRLLESSYVPMLQMCFW